MRKRVSPASVPRILRSAPLNSAYSALAANATRMPTAATRSKQKMQRQHFSIPFSAASFDLLSYGSKAIVCIIINRPETPPQLANLR